jgi:signal transduction histidine kinase
MWYCASQKTPATCLTKFQENNMNNAWTWFDNKNIRHYEFQTVVDILSFAENLPLRVMDYDALCRINIADLWYLNDKHHNESPDDIKKQSHKFCQHVETLFTEISNLQVRYHDNPDTEAFDSEYQKILTKNKQITPPPAFTVLKDSIKSLVKLEESVWLNQPSNPLPVDSLFRHCEEWRWWIFFWFFCQRDQLKAIANSNKDSSNNAFFIDSWKFYIEWLTLDNSDKKYLLIVGPIYTEKGLNCNTKQFNERYGKTLKYCYKAFHNCYTKGSLTHLAHDDIVRRMIYARPPISKSEVQKRVSSIKTIFQMLQLGLNNNRPSDYSYNDIYTITHSLISLERKSKQFESGEYSCYFSFSHSEKKHILCVTITIDKSKLRDKRITHIAITENCNETPKTDFPLQYIEYSSGNEEKTTKIAKDITAFNTKIEYWNEIYHVRRKAAQEIYIALLGDWLQNSCGSLDKEDKYSSKNKRFYNHICHSILDWVRADECNLYRFNHVNQTIDLIGNVSLTPLAEKWNAAQTTIEINASDNKEKSAVFRAISTNKNIFIENDKTQFYIGKINPEIDCPHSGIIVPITFQGRIYGALEILGFRQYSFQWSHQLILTNVAHLIANYIYSQQMLFALQDITRLALQNAEVKQAYKNQIRSAYTPLCEQLSKIFLSQCTHLWLKDSTNHHIYSLQGTTHLDLFNQCPHDFNTHENKKYVASYLIEKYKEKKITYLVGRIDINKNGSGFDKKVNFYIIGNDSPDTQLRNIIINQLKAKELLVFLLIDEKESDILGFVTLLNPKFYGYGDNWQNIINLVREQLVISLRTLDSEKKSRKADEAILMHEIKQDAWTLYRSAKRIEKNLQDFNRHAVEIDLKKNMKDFQLQWQKSNNNDRGNFVNLFIQLFTSIQALMENWKKNLKPSLNGQANAAERLAYKINLYELNKIISLNELYGQAAPDFNDIPDFINLADKCYEIKNSRLAVAKQKFCDIHIDIKPYYSIKMQRDMLNNFILNMIDNSVKYANPNSTIELFFFRTTDSYRLQIKNFAPALANDEQDIDLFELGVRAKQARQQDHNGDGVGLFIIAYICIAHKIRYSYDKEKALQGEYLFNFDFPMDRQNTIVKIESGYRR